LYFNSALAILFSKFAAADAVVRNPTDAAAEVPMKFLLFIVNVVDFLNIIFLDLKNGNTAG
jgi:hypothetical protein